MNIHYIQDVRYRIISLVCIILFSSNALGMHRGFSRIIKNPKSLHRFTLKGPKSFERAHSTCRPPQNSLETFEEGVAGAIKLILGVGAIIIVLGVGSGFIKGRKVMKKCLAQAQKGQNVMDTLRELDHGKIIYRYRRSK